MKNLVYLLLIVLLIQIKQGRKQKSQRLQKQSDQKNETDQEDESEEINGEKMQEYIRNKGTFIIAYVDVNQNLNDNVNNTLYQLEQESKSNNSSESMKNGTSNGNEGQDKKNKQLHKKYEQNGPAFGGLSSKNMLTGEYVENNLFDNTNVEFPSMCRKMWNKQQEVKVAQTAAKMLPCWKEAGNSSDATFYTLPILNASQLAEFYYCLDQKEVVEFTKQNIQPDDVMIKPSAFLKIALFNNPFRSDISWLEFWVYVCSDGVQPNPSEYMNAQQNEPLNVRIQQKVDAEQKLKQLRQKLYIKDQQTKAAAAQQKANTNSTQTSKKSFRLKKTKKKSAYKCPLFIQNAVQKLFSKAQQLSSEKKKHNSFLKQ